MSYLAVLGIEIHAELATRTGMFCSCANDPDASEPNVNICPVCLGLPGALPVLNAEAIHMLTTLASDLGSIVDPITKWDRKNYFYPDLPKGYQISQYDQPLLRGGAIELSPTEVWPLTRIHLEEDTAKLTHLADTQRDPSTSLGTTSESLVDFNRSGVPLAELVTEPIVVPINAAPALAKRFCETYQFVLQRRGISHADMEKGQMRCEANVSVIQGTRQEAGGSSLQVASPEQLTGTKVEVKNLNSFRSVERAVGYELKRQIAALQAGEPVIQETRGWDEARQRTVSQRAKETAAEYRYFPDPDLPAVNPRAIWQLDTHAPAAEPFPHALARQLIDDYGLKPQDADRIVANAQLLATFGEIVDVAEGKQAVVGAATSLYLNLDIAQRIVLPDLVSVAALLATGTLPKHHVRTVVEQIIATGRSAEQIVADEGLSTGEQASEVGEIVRQTLAENQDAVAKYRAGKGEVLGFLVGQAMKLSQGKADPGAVREALLKELSNDLSNNEE